MPIDENSTTVYEGIRILGALHLVFYHQTRMDDCFVNLGGSLGQLCSNPKNGFDKIPFQDHVGGWASQAGGLSRTGPGLCVSLPSTPGAAELALLLFLAVSLQGGWDMETEREMQAEHLEQRAGRVGPGRAWTGLAWPDDVTGAELSSACLSTPL